MRLIICALLTVSVAMAQSPISVRWEMGRNGAEKGWYSSKFVIKNVSGVPLASDWQLYFNQFSRSFKLPAGCGVDMKEVSTTYYQVTPNARYKTLAPGDTMVVDMLMRGTMVNICYAPQGGHVVIGGDMSRPLPVKIEVAELSKPGQWVERKDYPDGNRMYALNESLSKGKANAALGVYDIFPTPKQVTLKGGVTRLVGLVTLKGGFPGRETRKAAKYLKREMASRGVYFISGSAVSVELKTDKRVGGGNYEAYRLTVDNGKVKIVGASGTGLLNGVKTLVAALDHSMGNELPNVEIEDAPDFHYRGYMLDIARNFMPMENLRMFVDMLAYYKINHYQFHFTDDEAWRVEIPGLPELTQVASRRGCTLDEKEFLAQIFDGNGDPNDNKQSANGYLTREEFIGLLKYADARGVKIIPEVETPGHARAAIVAMRNRYERLKDKDMTEAVRYKLWDDNDQSEYSSAQSYDDDVLNVAQEGVFNFVLKVVDELELMYKAAGLKMDVIHLGGDEVAKGAWDKSPDVQALMRRNGFKNAHEVSEYYMRRITDELYPRGIKVEGWQEVAQNHDARYNAEMSKRFAGVNAWSTVGSRAKVPYELANDDYPVILSNVTNFYMDMGYSWHQYEQGLHWGGSVDEFAAWDAQPWDIYRTARTALNGDPIDMATAGEGQPTLERRENIIGVQAQMWGETLRNFDQVQRLSLPKVMGVVERGWNSTPIWAGKDEAAYEQARADYNLKIGTRELPVLLRRGYVFHLGQPGVKVEGGLLLANAQYPGEDVHYTFDGSEPTQASARWNGPVIMPKGVNVVKAKAFYLGRESVTTYLFLNE